MPTLVRPDGTLIDTTDEQAQRLSLLGYREQTPEERAAANQAQSQEDFYTQPGQVAKAAGEGILSGASLGGTDYLIGLDPEQKKGLQGRAAYNPGVRMGTSLLGAVAPLLLSGGTAAPELGVAEAVSLAPSSLLSRAATSLTSGIKPGLTQAVTRGVGEGAAYGATGAIDQAYLDDSPVTAEAVLHGIGWGAVVGGAFSTAAHGVGALAEGSEARVARAKSELAANQPVAYGTLNKTAGDAFSGLKSEVGNFRRSSYEAIDQAEAQVNATFDALSGKGADLKPAQDAFNTIRKAARAGKFDDALAGVDAYAEKVNGIAADLGVDMPDVRGALNDYVGLQSAAQQLERFPRTVEGFARMSPGQAEDILSALESMKKVEPRAPELGAPVDESLESALKELHPHDVQLDPDLEASLQKLQAPDVGEVGGRIERTQPRSGGNLTETLNSLADEPGAPSADQVTNVGKRSAADTVVEPRTVVDRGAPTTVGPGPEQPQLTQVGGPKTIVEGGPTRVDVPKTVVDAPPTRVEQPTAALPVFNASTVQPVSSDAIVQAKVELARALGMEPDAGVRDVWRAARAILKSEGKAVDTAALAEKMREEPSFLQRAAGYVVRGKVYGAARAAGMGHGVSFLASSAAGDLLSGALMSEKLATLKASVMSRIDTAVASFKATARGVQKVAPATTPLAISLVDGTEDRSTKDKNELAMRRIQETAQLRPVIRDRFFQALGPLSQVQPKLAPAIQTAGVTAFQSLAAMMPSDPGVVNRLNPIWKPSDVQTLTLEKQMAAFRDPIGTATQMISSGKFDPISVEAVRAFAPAVWQEMRVKMLQKITEPAVNAKLSYEEQIGLSAMLDLPIHSSMTPAYIASSQAIFTQLNQGLKANPRIGQSGGFPNPSDKNNPNATSSQKMDTR